MQSKAVTTFEVPMLNDVDILACLHVAYRTRIGRQEKGRNKEKKRKEKRRKKEHRLVMQNSQMRGRVPIIHNFSHIEQTAAVHGMLRDV